MEDLLDEPLRRLDAVLEDETLVSTVLERQAQRWPQSRWRGCPGTPADMAIPQALLLGEETVAARDEQPMWIRYGPLFADPTARLIGERHRARSG
ncbi:MAG: hypothetical protein QN122_10545 [Armatimonadota bacterium]|nr:hypothetical protein [Armatimonadota bacterium]MDR7487958.1 hypothetical protein [Armatimonadota bacterium]MDR7491872.1 hypothetical protein [Armatimonadota bacterium]MDR7528390.1 hypothetical protein [Armatimonadota bacterium]MDR7574120.1 hypothetical protein [Armatimonadota bacterium]